METMRAEEGRKLLGKVRAVGRVKRSKFGVRTDARGKRERTVDGTLFASKKEALRYVTLRQLERAGEITGLKCQPRFKLWTFATDTGAGILDVCEYRADFQYVQDGKTVFEDVKGKDTALSKLKRKWLKLQNNIDVVLV